MSILGFLGIRFLTDARESSSVPNPVYFGTA